MLPERTLVDFALVLRTLAECGGAAKLLVVEGERLLVGGVFGTWSPSSLAESHLCVCSLEFVCALVRYLDLTKGERLASFLLAAKLWELGELFEGVVLGDGEQVFRGCLSLVVAGSWICWACVFFF